MIIDFHVHCFVDSLAQRAVASLARASNLEPRSDGTVAGIKASMEKAGIDRSVLLSIATKPQQTPKITQWAASAQSEETVAFASIHPDYADWKNELTRVCEYGIKGLKFHPEYQNFYVDDRKMYPIYEKAAELGLVMIFHAGRDLGFPGPYHCTPDRMRSVVRSFAGAKIVAAHMGGYDCWDDVERFLAGESVYFDTSFGLRDMEKDQFLRIVEKHGYDKLLFGSDSPWGDQTEELERIRGLKLPLDAEKAVLAGNAAKLLGLTCACI